jgi:hypothetical protein
MFAVQKALEYLIIVQILIGVFDYVIILSKDSEIIENEN